ncbi:MAG TPA: peptidylprolyl isomerase [Sphingomicrobium sp.]
MLSSFRRLSNSKIGTTIVALFFILVLVGFAMGDLQNVGTGNLGFGSSSSTLVKVGSREITDRQMNDLMQRRLQEVRQQNPEADYATISKDFDLLLDELIDQQAILAFADKYGFKLSKRLIDAQIAQIPGVKGLNGQVSPQQYQQWLAQQRMTDGQLRDLIAGQLIARYLAVPLSTEPRVPIGVARPYASMLLEAREGGAAVIPITFFTSQFKPTDADIQAFYNANRARYMVPEQRIVRIAPIGPEQVAGITATPQEIEAYYNANQATYGARETRTLSQAVVPDQATANAIAARARAGGTLATAAAPAGANAAVTTQSDRTRQDYASIAGDKAAAAAFSAPQGAVVGPIQSDFGWVVVKVDSVNKQGGKTLDQAREEIGARLLEDKRKAALEDLVARVQDSLDEGLNYAEAAQRAKLQVITTPLVMSNGTSRTDPAYKFPQEMAPALKIAFEVGSGEEPELVTLPNGRYAMVAPSEILPAAPAPLASIKEKVRNDWITDKAMAKARAVASAIAAKASSGMSLAEAIKQSGVPAPIQPLASRRMQIAQTERHVPAPIRMLFSLTAGKSRIVPDEQGRGYYVVKVDKIVPGNALLQPALIGQVRTALQQGAADNYARQFIADVRADTKIKRNDKAIQALRERLATSGG